MKLAVIRKWLIVPATPWHFTIAGDMINKKKKFKLDYMKGKINASIRCGNLNNRVKGSLVEAVWVIWGFNKKKIRYIG